MVMAHGLAREGTRLRGLFLKHGRGRNRHELVASKHLAEMLQLPIDVMDLDGARAIHGAFRPGQPVPEGAGPLTQVVDADETPREERLMRKGLSPFSVMITIALYYTHVVDGEALSIGLIKDQSGAGPRLEEYLSGLADLDHLFNPRLPRVDIRAPQIHMTKADVLSRGLELGTPLERSWSCLFGGQVHCGRCSHCVARKAGYREIGHPDPTRYERTD
jgi:7-cyano-7-deazaguanine synthase